ncbi:STAS domain-containing protein [Lentzea sp. NPDC060358]|uniref:STAS domain-containing protein n=1 Tax=Lentzea sp. NPDC060358 TaxID=3347103 RepID=UPI003648F490
MTSSGTVSAAGTRISRHDDVLVAVISGELDMTSVDGIAATLFDELGTGPGGMVVDLSVSFLGSSGLSMLLELYRRARRAEIGFALVAVEAAAVRPLTASALAHVLPVTGSVDEALALVRQNRD